MSNPCRAYEKGTSMKFKLLLVLGALVFTAASCDKKQEAVTPSPVPASQTEPTAVTQEEIQVSDNGFTPKDLTVKKGSTVTFTNKSSKTVWPASDPHPTHTDDSAFDPKKGIEAGASWSFTFNQVGEWGLHDHLSPFRRGTVTVTE